jgi:hypothetical protein
MAFSVQRETAKWLGRNFAVPKHHATFITVGRLPLPSKFQQSGI